MAAYNILEARNNLSRIVAMVESGAEATLMRRGKPVAKIVPITAERTPRTGAEIVAWLKTNPLPPESRRAAVEIEESIREMREAGE